MAKKIYEKCVILYEYIFRQLEQLKFQEMVHLQEDMVYDDLEMNENGGVSSRHIKLLENLFKQFEGGNTKHWNHPKTYGISQNARNELKFPGMNQKFTRMTQNHPKFSEMIQNLPSEHFIAPGVTVIGQNSSMVQVY